MAIIVHSFIRIIYVTYVCTCTYINILMTVLIDHPRLVTEYFVISIEYQASIIYKIVIFDSMHSKIYTYEYRHAQITDYWPLIIKSITYYTITHTELLCEKSSQFYICSQQLSSPVLYSVTFHNPIGTICSGQTLQTQGYHQTDDQIQGANTQTNIATICLLCDL